MRKATQIFLIFLLLLSVKGFGQVSIQFIPELYGLSMDGLLNASIINGSGKQNVRLSVLVSEAKAGRILNIQTAPFSIVPGNNFIPPAVVRSANIQVSSNPTGNYIRRNSIFPQGEYEYAFTIISASSSEQIIVDQTFNHDVVPPAPLDLIEPFNQDQICEKRPMMTWQPSFPQIPGMLYELQLVEIKKQQNAVEALNYNLPIVNQRGIVSNILMYPPVSKDLEQGKKYAWQVTAYKDQTVINRSEVWEFKVDCQDSVSNVLENDFGYRDIEDLAKGNYYVAEGILKFALVNAYAEQKLSYEIKCITDPASKLKSLPKITLKRGQNKIRMDFSHNNSFKDGYSYIIRVNLQNSSSKSLRFIYKDIE